MSRIGNKVINFNSTTSVTVDDHNMVTIKGPKGEMKQWVNKDITVKVEGDNISLSRASDEKKHKALHGLYRALIANHVEGVTNGYEKQLELVGVGYKATNQGNLLELSLGYSHVIFFQVPPELKVATEMLKGQNPKITLSSFNKELLGEVCAKIRKLRKIEPFKGKGIKFVGEVIRRKVGKTSAK